MNPLGTRSRGYTLVELMIAVGVVALLGAIAYPSYASYVGKSRRSDATVALLGAAQAMERFYSEHATYTGATLGSTGLYPGSSSHGYYSLAITAQSASGFAISATPTGAQENDACGTYTYNETGTKGVTGGTLGAAACW
jgi:type IV pilus assembly protein PilE